MHTLLEAASFELEPLQPFAFDPTFQPSWHAADAPRLALRVPHDRDRAPERDGPPLGSVISRSATAPPSKQKIYSRLLLGTPVDEPAPVAALLDRIARWSPWRALAIHYLWEDLFWRHRAESVDWRAPLIRL
jgi:hypothetical protein